ncbi:MAG: hypothetical protein ABW133_14615 [Polyangiaceae bacterium]
MRLFTILMFLGAGSLVGSQAIAQAPAQRGTGPAPAGQPGPAQGYPQGAQPGQPAAQGAVANDTKIEGVATKDVANLDDPHSPFEKPDTTYRFIGARFRYIIVPKFYMGIFGDGGTTAGVPAFGPEFTIRKNGFEYVMSAMYASYSIDQTPFKAKTDGNDAWEIVDTNLKSIYLMSDFLWSAETSPKFSFLYGGGFGLGLVVGGDIHRQQAHPGSGDPNNPGSYVPCQGPQNPMGQYCGRDNDHYGSYTEPSWANGGSKPLIFPWMSLQTGFRYKPTREFTARVDIGWNILNGPFFGLAMNYGLL